MQFSGDDGGHVRGLDRVVELVLAVAGAEFEPPQHVKQKRDYNSCQCNSNKSFYI